ncbi:MAG TPA: hypothetical protein VD794_00060 [Flavisolibacter sp.]|nr:hypothetical protein [Flavisolibacter sp.]
MAKETKKVRNTITGRYTTKEEAKASPSTTVSETNRLAENRIYIGSPEYNQLIDDSIKELTAFLEKKLKK